MSVDGAQLRLPLQPRSWLIGQRVAGGATREGIRRRAGKAPIRPVHLADIVPRAPDLYRPRSPSLEVSVLTARSRGDRSRDALEPYTSGCQLGGLSQADSTRRSHDLMIEAKSCGSSRGR